MKLLNSENPLPNPPPFRTSIKKGEGERKFLRFLSPFLIEKWVRVAKSDLTVIKNALGVS